MADDLCGPSNALQSFRKQTSVDRALQQDRFSSRQAPSQGFRSEPGPSAGVLDPHFEAFQAGFSSGPPQPELQLFQTPPAFRPPPKSTAAPPALSGWASDFQALHQFPQTSLPQSFPPQPARPQTFSPQPALRHNPTWHQDFLQSQIPTPSMHSQTPVYSSLRGTQNFITRLQQQNPMGAFAQQDMSVTARGKQRQQSPVQEFDDAAFERAFEQASANILAKETSKLSVNQTLEEHARSSEASLEAMNAEYQLAKSLTDILRLQLSRGLAEDWSNGIVMSGETFVYAESLLNQLEYLEQIGELDRPEADAATGLVFLSKVPEMCVYPKELRSREPEMKDGIDQLLHRVQQDWPKLYAKFETTEFELSLDSNQSVSDILYPQTDTQVAALIRSMAEEFTQKNQLTTIDFRPANRNLFEEGHQESQPEGNQQDQSVNHDELADTAARLLDSVADNTSKKFQESQFLGLMRKIRDKEVHVEDDNFVETVKPPETSSKVSPALA
ncbi:hypothetical protein M501DRAFT_405675 [Patellaria atrata CBS 101060]|uniref:Uncharacterized protein n=1 Tax=Patellaria atrata CBS 101060 TaxID=1346257 RepID=A0A9P4SIA1_9PEZI|nr:hypothetical protein M501DRAFT_405675 [Patellaria atrata CBS 101060]